VGLFWPAEFSHGFSSVEIELKIVALPILLAASAAQSD
jgi:hypothetical protein